MEKTHGEIQYIKETGNGEKFGKKWTLYSVKIDNIFYSGFGGEDKEPFKKFSIGDNVSLEFEKKGEYNNIKEIVPYNKESEELYDSYIKKDMLNNSVREKEDNIPNKEIIDSVEEMINTGIFIGEFNINGDAYEISIKKK